MVLSRSAACLTLFMLFAVATPVEAGWWTKLCAEMERDRQRNNCWPIPFSEPDKQVVRDTMEAQVSNGWRRNNLLGDHHFTEDSSELTTAAKLKVRWILTQVPEHRRTLYVQRGLTPEATQARVDAVQRASVKTLPAGQLPAVLDTHLMVEGRPAADVDSTNSRFQASKPEPQLPEPSDGDE